MISGFYDNGYFYTILLWENNLASSTHTKFICENYEFFKSIKISKIKIYRSGEKIKGKIKKKQPNTIDSTKVAFETK